MKALVLAAGFGIRLKEVIHDRPKVMAPINGRPFLEYVLESLRKNGIDEVVIGIGFLGDYIRDYFEDGRKFGLKLEYSEDEYPVGTGGTIKNAQRFFKDTFLVINGDTYLDFDLSKLVSFHQEKKAWATIALVKREKTLDSGLVLKKKSGQIASFIEKPKRQRSGFVSGGYYVFEPQVLKLIKSKKRISLEREIFPKLVKKGKLLGFEVGQDFIDIGTPDGYREAQRLLGQKKRKVVKAQAPVRVNFITGGTDLPSYFLKHGGCVVAATIDKYAHVIAKESPAPLIRVSLTDFQREETYPLGKVLPYDGGIFDHYKAVINRLGFDSGVEIKVWGDFPGGSGLGTSSAFTVALIGALLKLKGERITKEKVARLAIEVEREILKIPGGWQDQYSASYGGFNFIEFLPKGRVKVKPINLEERTVKKLQDNLALFYIASKRSEKSQQTHLKKAIEEDVKTQEAFGAVKDQAKEILPVLRQGNVRKLGTFLDKVWEVKKKSSSKITTGLVNKIYEAALKEGARGGKLLGAGGGGCFLMSVSPEKRQALTKAMEKMGVREIPFKFEFVGLKVETHEE